MTAKDFRLIAWTIAALPAYLYDRAALAARFADELATANPAFDRGRFIAAAMGEPLSKRDA